MKSLTINNRYGEKLAAYLFTPQEEPRYIMVVCHGFRGGKENGGKIFTFAEKLKKLGLGVMAFDFSGSGQSEGDFLNASLSRQAEDLRQVIDHLDAEFSVPIILLGRSFGGSTVLAGGSGDQRIAGYVLWSTPINLEQTFAGMLPDKYSQLKCGEIITIRDEAGEFGLHPDLIRDFSLHDMDSYLQQMGPRPVLVVHATDDEVVEPGNALYMQERLEKCSLTMVDGAGHRFLDKITHREDITLEWLINTFDLEA